MEGLFSKHCNTSSSNCSMWTDYPCPAHCSENTCDKPSVLPCHSHTLHHSPSECWQFSPGEVLHVDVDLTTAHTHTCKVLTLQACHKKYEKQLTCTFVEWIAVIADCVTVGCVSGSVAERLNLWSQLVTNYNFFLEYFSDFAYFPTLIRPPVMICGTTRMHVQHIGAWW